MDIVLYYKEEGKGYPLILLHGNGENSEYFKHQIKYFASKYRVIAVDTRGHGMSPRGTSEFTIGQFADDLNKLMERLSISQAIILGFSDGANTAMKFVFKYPDKVKALILNGGNLNSKGVKTLIQFPIDLGYKFTKLFANKSKEAKKNMEMLGLMVNEPNIQTHELKNIQVPTLVIVGSKDMIKESHTRQIAKNISGSELRIIKGNHFIANKEHELFNETIEEFLQKNRIL